MSRDPNMMNKPTPILFDTIHIKSLPPYDIEDYDLYDEKDIEKYYKDIERICRNSYEYKQLMKFFKNNLDMSKCAIYENVRNDIGDLGKYNKIAIHVHHEPLTLYEVVKIVTNKRITLHENMDEQITSKEVMLLHYNLLVGLIPLAETVHELVHNQYLFIPTTKVFGFYRDFLDMYDDYVDNEIKEKIDRIEAYTSLYDGSDKFILDTHLLYTDVSGQNYLPKYEDVKQFLSDRIANMDNYSYKQIKENVLSVYSPEKGRVIDIPWEIKLD